MKIFEVTKIIVEQSATEVWDQIKAYRDTLPAGDERVRLSNLMNQINKSTTTPERAADILADAGLGGQSPDDGSPAGQQPNSEPATARPQPIRPGQDRSGPAVDTPQSAREVWNQIKAQRDALPQGPERVRLSNLMNQINVSTTSPQRAAAILAQANLAPPEAADTPTAEPAPAPRGAAAADTPPGDSAADVAQDDAARTAAQPATPTEPTATRPQPTRPGQQTSGANFGAINSNLRRGSRGEGVRALQQRLGINADGIFGPQTDQAVRSFQQQNNLQVDGIVGRQTLAALQGQSPAPDPGRITAAPATSVRPQARPAQTGTPQTAPSISPTLASKQNTGNALIEGIIKLAGVKKKSLNEASISINGADANEVAEIVRLMQLAGASGAKPVDTGMINQPDSHMGSCGCSSCAAKQGPKEPDMGDMIRMISSEEENLDGDFQGSTTAPDEEYSDFSASIPSGNDLHKEKGAYPATAGGDNPMRIKEQLMKALAEKKKAKPDFLDIDGDGDTKEPMKKAAKDAGKGKGSKPKKGEVPPQFKKKTNEGFATEEDTADPKSIIRQRTIELARKANVSMKNVNLDKVYKYIEQRKSLGKGPVNQQPEKIEKLIEYYQNMASKANPNYNDRVMDLIYDKVVEMVDEVAPMIHNTSVNSNEAEVQAPSHELSDTARKATAMAQKIKRKINSGEEMDDLDYNQMAELGTTLSRVGASFGPKNMKDVLKHMQEYTDDRNQEGNKYPEFTVDRFKELVAMASN